MDTSEIVNGQFVDANLLQTIAGTAKSNLETEVGFLHTPGLINPNLVSITPSGLTLNINFAYGGTSLGAFAVVFSDGTVVQAHGTNDGSDSQSYSVDLSSLVPTSGTTTAYVTLAKGTIGAVPETVVGVPPGHPDYNPNFNPFEFYSITKDTLVVAAANTNFFINNATLFELCRVTLSAGQNTITSGEIITTDQHYASSVLNPTGVAPGSYSNANITVGADGRVTSISSATSAMVGEIKAWPVNTLPSGFLYCNGAAVSRTTYAALFAVLGVAYGAGDGSTTFNVPDFCGRTLFGNDAMGGVPAKLRLTVANSNVDGGNTGGYGGDERLAAHAHGLFDAGHTHTLHDSGHTHLVSDPGHAHSVADPGHTHGVTDRGHVHGIYDPGHGHGVSDPGHTHYISGSSVNAPGNEGIIGNPGPNFSLPYGTSTSYTSVSVNGAVSNVSVDTGYASVSINAVLTGIGVSAAATGIYNDAAVTGVTMGLAATGITVSQAGGGGSGNIPPAAIINYIIFAGN